ncbi:MAG: hypothetical protein D8M59_14525 [Planctomycetes bacterium]|nr:hypothetical protein [Planctomycetota bacterium]
MPCGRIWGTLGIRPVDLRFTLIEKSSDAARDFAEAGRRNRLNVSLEVVSRDPDGMAPSGLILAQLSDRESSWHADYVASEQVIIWRWCCRWVSAGADSRVLISSTLGE